MGSDKDTEIPETGAVFTFGKSRFAENIPSHFFIRNDPIMDITCGDEHTIVVCQKGRAFAFGCNEFGQLGLGHRTAIAKPSCIKNLKPLKCKRVAAGHAHTLFQVENGDLYSCGNNNEGQLGLGHTDMKDLPNQITCLSSIVDIAAGANHSIALKSNGKVYVWGSNSVGQLGFDQDTESIEIPTLLEINEQIIKVACGYYHTMLLTDKGQIYTFGEGERGKLGLCHTENTYTPTIVQLDSKVTFADAGGHHSIIITEKGQVWGWGSNTDGQLGLKDLEAVSIPTIVPKLIDHKIVTLSCGDIHTGFISDNGTLLMCGDTRHEKLGLDRTDEIISSQTVPLVIKKFSDLFVEKISCGGCHTMVLARPIYNNLDNLDEKKDVISLSSGKSSLPPLHRKSKPFQNHVDIPNTDNIKEILENELLQDEADDDDQQLDFEKFAENHSDKELTKSLSDYSESPKSNNANDNNKEISNGILSEKNLISDDDLHDEHSEKKSKNESSTNENTEESSETSVMIQTRNISSNKKTKSENILRRQFYKDNRNNIRSFYSYPFYRKKCLINLKNFKSHHKTFVSQTDEKSKLLINKACQVKIEDLCQTIYNSDESLGRNSESKYLHELDETSGEEEKKNKYICRWLSYCFPERKKFLQCDVHSSTSSITDLEMDNINFIGLLTKESIKIDNEEVKFKPCSKFTIVKRFDQNTWNDLKLERKISLLNSSEAAGEKLKFSFLEKVELSDKENEDDECTVNIKNSSSTEQINSKENITKNIIPIKETPGRKITKFFSQFKINKKDQGSVSMESANGQNNTNSIGNVTDDKEVQSKSRMCILM